MNAKELAKRVFPPMLATLAQEAPEGDWAYELKYDGFRAIVAIVGDDVAMISRNELDLAPRFPKTYQSLKRLKVPDLVVDGEVVVLDDEGAPRFQLLQGGGNEQLVLFDILWLDGEDLRKRPYADRRRILETLCSKAPKGVALSRQLETNGKDALKYAARAGWEGIIAKKRTSLYEGRRSKEWLKVKALHQQELVIVGWNPSTSTDFDIGSLHLAVNENGVLRYAGKVGTGFNAKMRKFLRGELEKDEIEKPLVEDAPRVKVARWVKPRLVAEIAFTEWTADRRLRHPSFLGLREDKSPKEVVREKAMPVSEDAKNVSRVKLSNPDRLLYPRDRITKKDVAEYYEAVAKPMLRALKDRPLALEHWNQGIDKPAWFQQNIGKEGPPWLRLVETPTRTSSRNVKHLVVDSVDSLRWLAQMSVLTTHMWSSREGSLEEPDWVIFDLDPAKGKGIEQAIEAAGILRRLLDNLELPSVPKTSGKRGIHVFVPLKPGHSHEQAADFAFEIAAVVAGKVPTVTVERSIAKRRGRLYLDAMQNGYGKTIVAPYSLRAIDGAPVSAPLKWSEVTKKLDPLKYNLRTMPNRLAKVGDLFADVFKDRVTLPRVR
jgi:bifunctional non-homologous end joining protein LigD